MSKVRVFLEDGMARFRGLMTSSEHMPAFQRALDGARYSRQRGGRLAPIDKLPPILSRLQSAGFDVVMTPEMTDLLDRTRLAAWSEKMALRERIDAVDAEIFAVTGEKLFGYQKTGAEWLSGRMGALLCDEMGCGKAIWVEEEVLRPDDSVVRIGDLKIGDLIVGSSGHPTKVIGVYPQGTRDAVRMIFSNVGSDKFSVVCDLEHLWTVYRGKATIPVTLTLSAMIEEGIYYGDASPRWRVPIVGGGYVFLTSLLKMGKKECVCIKVNAADELFALGNGILTHNTRQAIVAAPKNAPVLVICNSAAKFVWAGEMAKCRPNMKVRVLQGRGSFRWPREGEMVVINYDILPDVHDASGKKGRRICHGELPRDRCPGCHEQLTFGKPPPPGSGPQAVRSIETVMGHKEDCDGFKPAEPCPGCHELLEACLDGTVVIGDEAHNIKTAQAARTRKFRAIAEAARRKSGRTWLLTGTPMENEAKELWSVMMAAGVAEEAFGGFATFARLFKAKQGFWGTTWGMPGDEDVPEIVERSRRVMLRRMKKDVQSQLPEKLWQPLVTPVSKEAMALCEEYLRRLGGIDHLTDQIEKEKLDFKTMSAVRAALAAAKIPAMLEVVRQHEEDKELLIVFSCHRAPIDLLGKMKGWRIITGDESAEKKAEAVALFQAGKLKGLGLTVRAGGTAITLTRGSRQLWVDRDWNPGKNAQAEDRQHRIGAKNTVVIMMLEADHILDRRVNEVVLRKQKLIERSVDASTVKDDASLTKEERAIAESVEAARKDTSGIRHGTTEEDMMLEALRSATFESRFLEKTAQDIVEEADALGLSSARWGLVEKLIKQVRKEQVT